METFGFSLGRYRLSRDVHNPTPDRRNRTDWSKKPGWPAGTLFVVTANQSLSCYEVSVSGDRNYMHRPLRDMTPAFRAALVPDPPTTVEETLELANIPAQYMMAALDRFITEGRLTLKELMDRTQEEWDKPDGL